MKKLKEDIFPVTSKTLSTFVIIVDGREVDWDTR
jgi:hypothetical protein